MLAKWGGEKNSQRFEKCLPNAEEKRNSQRFKKCLPNDEEKSVEIEVGFAVYLLAVVCPDDRYHAHTLNEERIIW